MSRGTLGTLDEAVSLADLVDAEAFGAVCRSMGELFGIGIRIFDVDGNKIVDVCASTGDHCGYLFTVHPTRVMCTQLVGEVRSCGLDPSGQPRQIDCFSGLRYQVVPIVLEGSVLGRIIFGPYAPQGLTAPPAPLRQYEPALDLNRLKGFLDPLPRPSEAAVARILDNAHHVIQVLIHAAYKASLASKVHIASITGAFADVERTSRDLRRANERLRELDRLKSNFIATVSHELRTPLTSIIGYTEMILDGMAGDLNDEQGKFLRTILEKSESLLSLIGQVLDLSRIESGGLSVNKRLTDPRELVARSFTDVEPQSKQRRLRLHLEVADDVQAIEVDAQKIHRVITNLLANAVKFTGDGGDVWVTLDVADAPPPHSEQFDVFEPDRNRFLRIRVRDSGIGIPEDKLEQVFESFFQVDNSSTREFGGTGLGLSIVRNFVSLHDGRVWADSRNGEGAIFTVLLPYRPANDRDDVHIDGLGGS